MATMLNNKMSSELHLNNANRHVRLCKQTNGAGNLVSAIQPCINTLKEKHEKTLEYKFIREGAYDDIILCDGALDDAIRNVSDGAKQYDRNNSGRPVYLNLFPDGRISDIIRSSLKKEADAAEQVLQRLKGLGEEHDLFSQVEHLSSAIEMMRLANSALADAETDVKKVVANEELAQADLRKQYEFNYLDAVKLFGKKFADRLFPKKMKTKQGESKASLA